MFRRWFGACLWTLGAMALLCIAADGRAQESLEARLRRLEHQNEELRQQTGRLFEQNQVLMQRFPAPGPDSLHPSSLQHGPANDGPRADGQFFTSLYGDAATADPPAEEWMEVGKDLEMTAVWRHGLWLESKDKAFRFHPGGRVQHDMVWMGADDDVEFGTGGTGPIRDGVNFRRARFTMEGAFYDVVEFYTEWDYINTADVDPTTPPVQGEIINTPAPTDLWVQFTQIPWIGTLRFGNIKPPISFEHLTSSRFLNFMERSLAFDAFIGGLDNGFRPGVMMFNATDNERVTWSIGAFKSNTHIFGWNQGDGEWDLTGRATWTPYYEDEGRHMVHLGLGASYRDLDEDRVRLRARTLLRNGPAAQHTPLVNLLVGGDDQVIIVPEFAMVWGPWTVQSEYFAVWVNDTVFPATGAGATNEGTRYFQSAYAEVLYFLTGEHRPYSRKGGNGAAFTRVIPHSNAFFVRDCLSMGAWQVGARYSWIDLNDGAVDGGEVNDFTLGLNWFINPNLKFQWNYTVADRSVTGTADGLVHGFGMRTAWDF